MKKIFLILCTSFIFLFTSCELLTYLLLDDKPENYEEGTKTVKCDPDAKIYLVKLNTTNEKIGANYTGKVTGASRSVDETFEKSYLLVTGKKEDLLPELEGKLIGLHKHNLGFEGMIKADDKALVEGVGGMEISVPSLEDIMIHLERRS